MATRPITGTRFLVTGASAGIGRELARQLVEQGGRVVATARRQELLETLAAELAGAAGEIHTVAADITAEADRRRLLEETAAAFGGLDVVVNNAGRGALGPFAESNASHLEEVMRLNFFAPVELIRAALPLLREGQHPMVVNIGSVLGHIAVPNKSEYCASKFALHGFSDSLRAELKPAGIDVLHVCPSTTQSDFFDSALGQQRPPLKLAAATPAWVARRTVSAIRQGRREIILTLPGKAAVWLDRLAPWLSAWVVSRFG